MSSSRPKTPSCTARRTAMADTGLLIDAAWNSVVSLASRPAATSAMPHALVRTTL